ASANLQPIFFHPPVGPVSTEQACDCAHEQNQTRQQSGGCGGKCPRFAEVCGQPGQVEVKSVTDREIHGADKEQIPVQQQSPLHRVLVRRGAAIANNIQFECIHG